MNLCVIVDTNKWPFGKHGGNGSDKFVNMELKF